MTSKGIKQQPKAPMKKKKKTIIKEIYLIKELTSRKNTSENIFGIAKSVQESLPKHDKMAKGLEITK